MALTLRSNRENQQENIHAQDSITRTGKLGQDVTPATSKTGMVWTKFSLARQRKKKMSYITEWVNCLAFGAIADRLCAEQLKKGDTLRVQGDLHIEPYEGKDGVKKESHTIFVDSFTVVKRAVELSQPTMDLMNEDDIDL